MDHAPSDYHHGGMNVDDQTATYHRFGILTKWAAMVVGVGILFFALLFCTPAGLGGAFFTAVVVAAVAIMFLRPKPSASPH